MSGVRFFTFEQFHNKKNIGSTYIRVHQLINNWPDAELYKYGELADALIFQKVYAVDDYLFPEKYNHGVKILDICDPDWLEGALVKRMVDAMDAVTCPTKTMQKFIQQLTDKPVVVIPDRFDLKLLPKPKTHKGRAKSAVWFGYSHNAVVLKFAVKAVEKKGFKITIISNEDPQVQRWGEDKSNYTYKRFKQETLYKELLKHDIVLLPKGNRPVDRFKSNNKTIIANLCGLPVVYDLESLEAVMDEQSRSEFATLSYAHALKNYDVKLSIQQYKDLINELTDVRTRKA